jgi:hypothetical protein
MSWETVSFNARTTTYDRIILPWRSINESFSRLPINSTMFGGESIRRFILSQNRVWLLGSGVERTQIGSRKLEDK